MQDPGYKIQDPARRRVRVAHLYALPASCSVGECSVRIAIIGLPNSTKTTVFNALTRGHSDTAAYSSGKFQMDTGVVTVPDERVDRLAAMFKPRKTIYAQLTYADMSGLDKGVGKGGL